MNSIQLPTLTRTKAEAQTLAAQLFPGEQTALARLKSESTRVGCLCIRLTRLAGALMSLPNAAAPLQSTVLVLKMACKAG
jgi:hypothetical protein